MVSDKQFWAIIVLAAVGLFLAITAIVMVVA